MIHIVMDSAGDCPEEWIDEYQIHVVPINIHFGERAFLQGVDLSNADFYRMAEETKTIPKTSQPTPSQFIQFYQKIANIGDTILSLHITEKLSGTLDSARMAAKELAGKYHVYPMDSASGSAAMGYMVREARLLERAGAGIDVIQEHLTRIRKNVQIVLTLDTLEYARRSGRVKTLQAALASILNVKPVITLKDGMLELGERVRTRSKSLEYILDITAQRVGRKLVNAAVVHSEDPQSGLALMEQVRARLNCKDLIMTELSIGIAANLGPGTIGIVAYPVEGD